MATPTQPPQPPVIAKPKNRPSGGLILLYLLEALVFLAVVILFDRPLGCWYQQLPVTIEIVVIGFFVTALGGIARVLYEAVKALLKNSPGQAAENVPNAILTKALVAGLIPCLIFLFYFLLNSGVQNGDYVHAKCPVSPAAVTAAAAATATAAATEAATPTPGGPAPSQTATPVGVQGETPTLSPVPTGAATVTPIPTSTVAPECRGATYASIQFILRQGWQTKTPDRQNHIALSSNETSGLTDLKGRVILDAAGTAHNCACSLRGSTADSSQSFTDIAIAPGSCSFSLPLQGSIKNAYIILKVDGGPEIPFVIDFP